ncbi:hypothetical protein [Salinisphaera hydrothermalis]|uniref:Uncharacterized protein n=1 Tax=Salinisphaera hydrothermalis (strain C41B8) TaxID=1304275 RepID=A0A084IGB5_SALHC|nr:hypothetical protein [Salinisphaera hydrothermalis]KEZ75749.1 hypothetical protein C41B8_18392 [Salinisphaera hydrothermalis C41B8]
MQVQDAISADQARQNMRAVTQSPDEAIASISEAIREASTRHRGHTTIFLARDHIEIEDMNRIVAYFRKRGFTVEDRCQNRDTFALKISWYPAQRRGA